MPEDNGAQTAYADTNIFVALLAGPAHPLHEGALGLFRRVAEGRLRLIVTPVVVAELVYAGKSVLGWTRPMIASRLAALLRADGLTVREPAAIVAALDLYGRRRRLDFPDAYLAGISLSDGPPAVASLDRDFDAIDGLQRVAA